MLQRFNNSFNWIFLLPSSPLTLSLSLCVLSAPVLLIIIRSSIDPGSSVALSRLGKSMRI